MKIEIIVPDYSPSSGLQIEWERGFAISVKIVDDVVLIEANPPGLITLAHHLLTLAQPQVPGNSHIHYDELGALESSSCELIIQKTLEVVES